MHVIVGLGNPGTTYAHTRHNLGWIFLDTLAAHSGARFGTDKKNSAKTAMISLGPVAVMLVKPQTFMNNSGEAVQSLVHFYKLKSEAVWVVSDDLDLPFGTVRVRHEGSAGGHQGLQSIIDRLGTAAFHRLRVGIGSNRPLQLPSEEYVLQRFTTTEQQQLPDIIDTAIATLTDEIQKNARTATGEG